MPTIKQKKGRGRREGREGRKEGKKRKEEGATEQLGFVIRQSHPRACTPSYDTKLWRVQRAS